MNVLVSVTLLMIAAGPEQELDGTRRIGEQLMAPCCYSENVAQHRSEVSLQIRREISSLLHGGKTDREIIAIFKERYGHRILVEPEGSTGRMLTVMPVLALIVGVALTTLIIRRMLQKPARAAPAGDIQLPEIPED